MYNLSAICKAANELVKKGYSKSESFKKAWEFAKNVVSKVSGVTFGKRAAALERLTHYKPEQISVQLIREENNQFDNNAIAVMATVEGKGSYVVGYVPAEVAKILSSIIDKGVAVKATLNKIVGGWFEGQNYGMRIALAI